MNDQAKLLLSAYRPGGQDAHEPDFREALQQAERDPQLRTWFAESQEFDRAVAERLRAVPAPAKLRETILAGAKVSRPAQGWIRPRIWAVAAALVALVAFAALWSRANPSLAPWQTRSLHVLEQIEHGEVPFDHSHAEAAQLVTWLGAQPAPAPASLPPALAQQQTFGCKIIQVQDRVVSLICFRLPSGDQAHLFTTARAGLRDAPPEGRAVFARHHIFHLASWSAGEQVHMLASDLPPERLRQLLPASVAATRTNTGHVLATLP